jgi:hypothetical protein
MKNHDFRSTFQRLVAKSSTHALEKCCENPDFIFCSSFQNLRLGWIKFVRPSKIFVWGSIQLHFVSSKIPNLSALSIYYVLKG